MFIELGHFSLILAATFALLQAAPLFRPSATAYLFAQRCAFAIFSLISLSLLALLTAYATSDFSVLNVASNSNTLKPIAYRVAAMWGNHEGSMLLWIWMMSLWTALYALRARLSQEAPERLARTLGILGLLAGGFAFFIILTSNPFLRLDPTPPEGLDLNPVLQDPLLIAHPPFLYAGVTGFALVFAAALAALIEGRVDAAFAQRLRPWTAAAWSLLTVGITLGALWAYYELGWGGFWFWDPVENISLLPWLAGLALLHSLRALERRNALPGWTLLLAIIPFILVVLGTFLVRSGLLTSVHAFAADPARGIFLLALTVALATAALTLYAVRAPRLSPGAPFAWLSRDSAVLINNVFLSVALVTVFLGTIYPIVLTALNIDSVSVGAPYYVAVFTPLLLPFAVALGISPALAWRTTPHRAIKNMAVLPLLITLACLVGLAASPLEKTAAAWVGTAAGVWVLSATLSDLWRKSGHARALFNLPAAQWAMTAAHAGFALMILGATSATQWGAQETVWMKPGDSVSFAGHTLSALTIESGVNGNHRFERLVIALRPIAHPQEMSFLTPEKRFYPVQDKTTSETALALRGFGLMHAVMGDRDPQDPARWVVRLYAHPMVLWVFIGGGLMALGGAVSLFERRHRERGTPA